FVPHCYSYAPVRSSVSRLWLVEREQSTTVCAPSRQRTPSAPLRWARLSSLRVPPLSCLSRRLYTPCSGTTPCSLGLASSPLAMRPLTSGFVQQSQLTLP